MNNQIILANKSKPIHLTMTRPNILSSSILLFSMLFLSGKTPVNAKLLRGGDANMSTTSSRQQQQQQQQSDNRALIMQTGQLFLDSEGRCKSLIGQVSVFVHQQICIDNNLTTAPTSAPTICEDSNSITGYRFFPGQDSQGFDIGPGLPAFRRRPDLANDIEALANHCSNVWEDCVAFNTDGWFKNHVRPMDQWEQTSDLTNAGLWIGGAGCAEGLYVSNSVLPIN